MSNKITVGQIVRRIRVKEFAPVYSLFGGDSFLEDFIITEITKLFLNGRGRKLQFSMDQDDEENLFRELYSISIFEDKRIISIREIKKLKSKNLSVVENSFNQHVINDKVLGFLDFFRIKKFVRDIYAGLE